MWYELIAKAESYLIPPRLFKFAHCFSRQIGLIKTLKWCGNNGDIQRLFMIGLGAQSTGHMLLAQAIFNC